MALAAALENKIKDCEIILVGSRKGMETTLSQKKWSWEMLEVPTLSGKNVLKKIISVIPLWKSCMQAKKLLKKHSPDCVVGMGGYVSGPLVFMAKRRKIPVAIVEPNAAPGLSNRLASRFADRIFVAFEENRKHFSAKKIVIAGAPIRSQILTEARSIARENRPFVLFVFGGSQGALAINQIVCDALPHLSSIRGNIHVIHQIGKNADAEAIQKNYRGNGISCELYPFIHNMGVHYGRAHLVIGRSGASTVAETMAIHRASILIPYPFSAGGHQEANADALAAIGGGLKILQKDCDGKKLAEVVLDFYHPPEKRISMENKLKEKRTDVAADKIAELCLELTHVSISG